MLFFFFFFLLTAKPKKGDYSVVHGSLLACIKKLTTMLDSAYKDHWLPYEGQDKYDGGWKKVIAPLMLFFNTASLKCFKRSRPNSKP